MKKIIFFVLLLTMSMGAMYYFSSQDGNTSSTQSQRVIDIVEEIRERVTLKNENLININNKIRNSLKGYGKEVIVRKAAHFGMYAIIGGTMMIVMYLLSKKILFSAFVSFTLTFLYAVYDETRQIAIDGRSGSLTDVFIDSTGAILSIFILSLIFIFFKGFNFISKKHKED